MKFIHLADCHLGYRQYGLKQREEDFMSAFEDALNVDYGKVDSVEFIVVAGDLFHHKEPSIDTLTEVKNTLDKRNVPVVVVRGNHDDKSLGATYDFNSLLPTTSLGDIIEIENVTITGLHWSGQKTDERINEILERDKERCKNGKYNIFVAHGGVSGVVGSTSEISTETAKKMCDVYDYIALGHIHHKYIIENKIHNPGSPEFTNISDAFAERGVFIVDTQTREVKHKPVKNRNVVVVSDKERLESLFSSDNKGDIIIVEDNFGYNQTEIEVELNCMKVIFKQQNIAQHTRTMISLDHNIFETVFGHRTPLAKSLLETDELGQQIEEYYDKEC